MAALTGLATKELAGLHALADGIRASSVNPALNFIQFDEMPDEVRRIASAEASKEVERQQKRQQVWRRLGWTAFILVVGAVIAAVFFAHIRIEGYIAVSPITVTAVQGEYATFRIGSEEAVDVLGRDTLTMKYRVDGFNAEMQDKWGRPAVAAGETIDQACLLKIQLTCGDLLRLGINPLQDFEPPSVQRHNAWMTLILRAALENGESEDCILLLREHPGTKPLLWQEK